MKRLFIIVSFALLLVACGGGYKTPDAQKEDTSEIIKKTAMTSFMGQQWGVPVKDFLDTFKFKDKLRTHAFKYFFLSDFELGNIIIKKIRFEFASIPRGLEMEYGKNDYGQFYFDSVLITFYDETFDDMLDILKMVYGKSSKVDKINTYWFNADCKRKIEACSRSRGGYSYVSFESYNPEPIKKGKKRKEDALGVL